MLSYCVFSLVMLMTPFSFYAIAETSSAMPQSDMSLDLDEEEDVDDDEDVIIEDDEEDEDVRN